MAPARKDRAPWLLLPAMLLTLSGVTLLTPRHAAQAAPLPVPSSSKPGPALDDDGDGDELLEHWGNPIYTQEERLQMDGMTGGFVLLIGLAYRRRHQRRACGLALSVTTVSETESISERRKAA